MLAALAWLFGRLSLLAVGGVNSTVPQIAREVVDQRHWLSAAQFAQLFAISNAAPGPNVLISTVIGAHMAGIAGGVVATLAMVLPSGILVIFVSRFWDRHREAGWRRIVHAALLPITAGLILAAGGVLVIQSDTGWRTAAVTLVCAWLAWRGRLHPLWLLAGGAAFGLLAM
ncbi:MAG: chromate transporter [Rhodospirillales bacterium 20-64-7]|nr:MAG: chromate transporter [Rhodospirillales bacterium 20-64-7]